MIVDLSISREVHNRLSAAMLHLPRLAQEAATARADVNRFKADELVLAKRDYDDAVSAATMEAYAEGVLNGKNQAERDVQLATFLYYYENVTLARRDAETAEVTLANLERAAAETEAAYKAAVYEVRALIAQAELQSAMLSLAAHNGDGDTESEPPF